MPRPFRTPLVPLVPLIGVGFSCWLIWGLPSITYWRFGLWLLIGLLVYVTYGRHHSRLAADGNAIAPVHESAS